MNSSSNKVISTIIGIVVIVLIVVGLVWLSNQKNLAGNGSTSGQNLSSEEVASILKELSKPAVGADGKPVPPPSPAETKAILKELAKPTTGDSASAKEPTPAEVQEILKKLQAK